jgi:hypothetical protein
MTNDNNPPTPAQADLKITDNDDGGTLVLWLDPNDPDHTKIVTESNYVDLDRPQLAELVAWGTERLRQTAEEPTPTPAADKPTPQEFLEIDDADGDVLRLFVRKGHHPVIVQAIDGDTEESIGVSLTWPDVEAQHAWLGERLKARPDAQPTPPKYTQPNTTIEDGSEPTPVVEAKLNDTLEALESLATEESMTLTEAAQNVLEDVDKYQGQASPLSCVNLKDALTRHREADAADESRTVRGLIDQATVVQDTLSAALGMTEQEALTTKFIRTAELAAERIKHLETPVVGVDPATGPDKSSPPVTVSRTGPGWDTASAKWMDDQTPTPPADAHDDPRSYLPTPPPPDLVEKDEPAPKPVVQWEYKEVLYQGESEGICEQLRKHGLEGWELVDRPWPSRSAAGQGWEWYMKRIITDPTEAR